MTFINFCCVVDKLLPRLLQTFAALFANFCRDFYKVVPCCSQTFAFIFLIVHKLFKAMLLELFAVRTFVMMFL